MERVSDLSLNRESRLERKSYGSDGPLILRNDNSRASVRSSARLRNGLLIADTRGISVALLGLWLAVVIFTVTKHEFWRDEVRALSLARDAASPFELFHLLRNEGHPVVWYLLLYVGHLLADTAIVLPIISIVVAFVAVATWMLCSPFPLWFKTLFIFSGLPLYEYSVKVRNYGISMLLFFIFAALYPHRRRYPLITALILALLANTNVHAAVLVCMISGMWAWDALAERAQASSPLSRNLCLPLAIVAVGLLLSALFAVPTRATIVTDVYSVSARALIKSSVATTLHPAGAFFSLVPSRPPVVGDLLLYVAVLGLIVRTRLFLVALGGQIALSTLFSVVYPGFYRHQGVFLVFLLSLYWIVVQTSSSADGAQLRRLVFNAGRYGALPILLYFGLVQAATDVSTDIRFEMSSSKAFGTFLNSSEKYRDAIILPEPGYIVESLPYYASNAIYLPRERRFANRVSFTKAADDKLSLGDLMARARAITSQDGRPVLIVLGHDIDVDARVAGIQRFAYKNVFSWRFEEVAELKRSARLVAEFNAAIGDENYRVYAVE